MYHGTETAVLALYELKGAISVTVRHSYPVFRSKLVALLQLPAGQRPWNGEKRMDLHCAR